MSIVRSSVNSGVYGVKVYDGIIPPQLCDRLMAHFDNSLPSRAIGRVHGELRRYSEVSIRRGIENKFLKIALRKINGGIGKYLDEHIAHPALREDFKRGITDYEPRMKRYSPTDEFQLHSDDSSLLAITRRLAYITYLNDDFEDGETIFESGIGELARVKPNKGSMLVFPIHPVMMHRGARVVSGQKYILNGFVNAIVSAAVDPRGKMTKVEIVTQEAIQLAQRIADDASRTF